MTALRSALLLGLLMSASAQDSAGWKPLFDGKSLAGWRQSSFARMQPGDVKVENGLLVLSPGRPLTGVTVTSDFPKIDYEIRFEAQRQRGNDFFASVTAPYRNSYFTWVLGGWGGDIVGISNIDGWTAADNETRSYFTFENGRWYTLRMRVTSERIQCWIDEQQVVDVQVAGRAIELRPGDILQSAPLGFASYNAEGRIRKIEYRVLGAGGKA